MFGFRLLKLLTLNVKPVSIQEYSFYLKSIKPKFEMPEIFKWKLIGCYVSGSPLLDITAYFRAKALHMWKYVTRKLQSLLTTFFFKFVIQHEENLINK